MSTSAEGLTTTFVMTPRQAILHSADLLRRPKGNNISTITKPTIIQVQGQVASWDPELQRLDIVHQGAKLIVRTTNCCNDDMENVASSSSTEVVVLVLVQGVLKKEQRRTFLEATKVHIVHQDE